MTEITIDINGAEALRQGYITPSRTARLIIDLDRIYYASLPVSVSRKKAERPGGEIRWLNARGTPVSYNTALLGVAEQDMILTHLVARAALIPLALYIEGKDAKAPYIHQRRFIDFTRLRELPFHFLTGDKPTGHDLVEQVINPFSTGERVYARFHGNGEGIHLPGGQVFLQQVRDLIENRDVAGDFVVMPTTYPSIMHRDEIHSVDLSNADYITCTDSRTTMFDAPFPAEARQPDVIRNMTSHLADITPNFFTRPENVTFLSVLKDAKDSYSLEVVGDLPAIIPGFSALDAHRLFRRAARLCNLTKVLSGPLPIAIDIEAVSQISLKTYRPYDSRVPVSYIDIGDAKNALTGAEREKVSRSLLRNDYIVLRDSSEETCFLSLNARSLSALTISRDEIALDMERSAKDVPNASAAVMQAVRAAAKRHGFVPVMIDGRMVIVDPSKLSYALYDEKTKRVKLTHRYQDAPNRQRHINSIIYNIAPQRAKNLLKKLAAKSRLHLATDCHLICPDDVMEVIEDGKRSDLTLVSTVAGISGLTKKAVNQILAARIDGRPAKMTCEDIGTDRK